ncbi:MAG: M15 family metallopeptidase [Proteobacteria bacterium]|nr:M15 family metallopeptidase [Pseudomonadota bacterium]
MRRGWVAVGSVGAVALLWWLASSDPPPPRHEGPPPSAVELPWAARVALEIVRSELAGLGTEGPGDLPSIGTLGASGDPAAITEQLWHGAGLERPSQAPPAAFEGEWSTLVLWGPRSWLFAVGIEGARLLAPARVAFAGETADGSAVMVGPGGWVATLGELGEPILHQASLGAGLVDVGRLLPHARVDLAYTKPGPLFDEAVYPADAICLLTPPAADAVAAAQGELEAQQLTLVFWDCYRPHGVQKAMWAILPDGRFVAPPSGLGSTHNRGSAVDVTLAQLGQVGTLEMPTGHDSFEPAAARAAGAADGVTSQQIVNRALLRGVMEAAGLQGTPAEWWHYSVPGAGASEPLDVPFPSPVPAGIGQEG